MGRSGCVARLPNGFERRIRFTCELSSPYSFFGQKPRNTRAIVPLEECYSVKDPFSPEREKFLVLGSKCCLCSKTVCGNGLQSVLHQALLFALITFSSFQKRFRMRC